MDKIDKQDFEGDWGMDEVNRSDQAPALSTTRLFTGQQM